MPPKSTVMAGKDQLPTSFRRPSENGLNLTSKQLTIIVGQGDAARTFYIHEDIAAKHAVFFASALHKGWKEADERKVSLPDDSPARFEVFPRFIYSGKVYSFGKEHRTNAGKDDEWGVLSDCWILGDKLGSVTFKDAVVDAICDKINSSSHSPTTMHQTIFTKSPSSALVRCLMVDIAVWKWDAKKLREKRLENDWKEFFKDLAVKLFELSDAERKGPAPFKEPECKYHEHVAGATPCYKTMF